MTKDEFKQYSELQEKFAKDVGRVTNYLGKINNDSDYNDLNYIDYYYLDEDGQVYTFGKETWGYGGYENHYGNFDAEMLTWTDDELREYVEQINKGKEEERVREEIEKARKKEEKERREYERLKEKYRD
jgi:predicted ribosome quality control (RQC) complex YloA/Tae2 family protein